jgi:phage shock protein C
MQYETPSQPQRQRLTRSSRDKMWAGVAGGLAEYFDLDPVVVRLGWVAAAALTGGLAVPVYVLMWWVMPRQDAIQGSNGWRTWPSGSTGEPAADSSEPAPSASAAEVAEGPRVDYASAGESTGAAEYGRAAASSSYAGAAGATGSASAGPTSGYGPGATTGFVDPGSTGGLGGSGATGGLGGSGSTGGYPSATEPAGYTSSPPTYTPPAFAPEYRRRRQKTAGVILIALGLIFLAGQLGIFNWIAWRYLWPLVLIAIGTGLLLRQNAWRR